MASCFVPAEKIIFPTWPEQPLRSSASGSGSAFMASIATSSKSQSPSGVSMVVQKKSRPPMSDAPSISTPFLPPSLITALSNFSCALAASLAALAASSSLGASAFTSLGAAFSLGAFCSLAFSFFAAGSAGAAAAGEAAAAAGEAAAASVSNLPGRDASLESEKLAMCLYQRSACTKLAGGAEMALKRETSFCVGVKPSRYEWFAMCAFKAAISIGAPMMPRPLSLDL
mmetsp:Transcript_43514/g.108275  ORF Transcript_43514/g.108275 Transcript_43514/m.108275 type:complete len:228 (+) Transcript_43514:493-1176(+)